MEKSRGFTKKKHFVSRNVHVYLGFNTFSLIFCGFSSEMICSFSVFDALDDVFCPVVDPAPAFMKQTAHFQQKGSNRKKACVPG